MHIDIGAQDGDDAKRLVRNGDVAVIAGEPVELPNGRAASRSMDNRLGAYIALEAARLVAEAGGAPGDVAAVAAVQEEVGDFGGRARVDVRARAGDRDRGRRDALDRRSRRRPEDRGRTRERASVRRSRAARRSTRASSTCSSRRRRRRDSVHDRGVGRDDLDGHGCDVPLARPASRRGSCRSRCVTCTRRRRSWISQTSRSARGSSRPSRSGWSARLVRPVGEP